jgi:hypothetical protein
MVVDLHVYPICMIGRTFLETVLAHQQVVVPRLDTSIRHADKPIRFTFMARGRSNRGHVTDWIWRSGGPLPTPRSKLTHQIVPEAHSDATRR